MVDSYFASPERSDEKQLVKQLETMQRNPVTEMLLDSVGGLLAVLNENRQVLALNDKFIKLLGLHDPMEALGLRPGEALGCVHANEMQAGCGTSKSCSTCGAVIAIVTSMSQNSSVEKDCALTVMRDGKPVDLYLKVRSQPVTFEGEQMVFLFIQDVTFDQQRAALERTFFHDVNNLISGLVGASTLLMKENNHSRYGQMIQKLSERLAGEVDVQRMLTQEVSNSAMHKREISTSEIWQELGSFFNHHKAAEGILLEMHPSDCPVTIFSDLSLLLRVLGNMLTNALEASSEGDPVRIWDSVEQGALCFHVWNQQVIPENQQLRIFRRNFSTKEGNGRGLGTFSMRLVGETLLGGTVSFSSVPGEGTTFTFALPLQLASE